MSAKKLKIDYGDGVFALPRENVLLTLPSAGAVELKVLMLAASDDGMRNDFETAKARICKQLDITESAFKRALAFWEKAGVMSVSEAGGAASAAVDVSVTVPTSEPKAKILQATSLPTYTESQTADIIEANVSLASVIDSCQQIAEKLFTPNEVQSIIGIYDHLGLTDEGYIETLYLYCKSIGKVSPRYVEKVAISLYDSDVTTTSALNDYIKRRETCEDTLSKIRSLVGVGDRTLTSKEKKMMERWCTEWSFDIDVITRAYEVTVDNIGEYKAPYMNKVLENWYGEGLTTIEAVESSLDAYRKNKAEATKSNTDFNVDEFFEAALARSERYLEKGKKEG